MDSAPVVDPAALRVVNIVARYRTTIPTLDITTMCREAGARRGDQQRSVQIRSYNEYNVVIGNNGRVTVLAETSEAQCAYNMWELANVVSEAVGQRRVSWNLHFQNVMGIYKMPGCINVPLMAADVGPHRVSYEPRAIHKATYTTTVEHGGRTCHVTFNVWPSGQINIMGTSSKETMIAALRKEFPVFVKYCNTAPDLSGADPDRPIKRQKVSSNCRKAWISTVESVWSSPVLDIPRKQRETPDLALFLGPCPVRRFSTESQPPSICDGQ